MRRDHRFTGDVNAICERAGSLVESVRASASWPDRGLSSGPQSHVWNPAGSQTATGGSLTLHRSQVVKHPTGNALKPESILHGYWLCPFEVGSREIQVLAERLVKSIAGHYSFAVLVDERFFLVAGFWEKSSRPGHRTSLYPTGLLRPLSRNPQTAR
jgi:hypothetical protein